MDELLPVVVGGSIGLAGGFVGSFTTLLLARSQAKRDDIQWIRQQRLAAYLPALAFLRQFEYRASVFFDLSERVDASIPHDAAGAEIEEMRSQYATEAQEYYGHLSRVESELAPVTVVGPDSVRQAVEAFARRAREEPTTWRNLGRDLPPVIDSMQAALRIPV